MGPAQKTNEAMLRLGDLPYREVCNYRRASLSYEQ